jgi:hypothetical protein
MSGPLIALAFGAGLLAPISPCGFALLPTYLAGFLQPAATRPAPQRLRRAVMTGGAVTVGFTATTAVIGIALTDCWKQAGFAHSPHNRGRRFGSHPRYYNRASGSNPRRAGFHVRGLWPRSC